MDDYGRDLKKAGVISQFQAGPIRGSPSSLSHEAESQPGGDAAAPESPHNKLEKTLERLGHDGVRQELELRLLFKRRSF